MRVLGGADSGIKDLVLRMAGGDDRTWVLKGGKAIVGKARLYRIERSLFALRHSRAGCALGLGGSINGGGPIPAHVPTV